MGVLIGRVASTAIPTSPQSSPPQRGREGVTKLPRRLGGEAGAADAHAALVVLPQFLGGMEMAQRARDRLEIVFGQAVGDVGVIKRLGLDEVEDAPRQCRDRFLVRGAAGQVRLALDVVADLGAVGIGIGDALVALLAARPRGWWRRSRPWPSWAPRPSASAAGSGPRACRARWSRSSRRGRPGRGSRSPIRPRSG